MIYRNWIKPTADFLAAFVCLLLSFPILLCVFISLYYKNSGKVFFIQKRPGHNERIFNLYKFKTMDDRKDKEGKLLPDHERLHNVGRWVRKLSLDELPQLINVLKGEMSLIGPRPLLVEYLPLYNANQKRRHEVRPGITGWAQINGRNTISWEEKFAYDIYYVEHQSFGLDIKIFLLTFLRVIGMRNINAGTEVTMEKFTGTKSK